MAQGNLVVNGDFELGLAFWNSGPTVPTSFGAVGNVIANNPVDVAAHSGMIAAQFGGISSNYPAAIWQDVPVLISRIYELVFHVTGSQDDPTDMIARVVWLNSQKLEIGIGLSIFIPRQTIGQGSETDAEWSTHAQLTAMSPGNAQWARVEFSTNGSVQGRTLYLDDVVFHERA